MFFQDLFKIPKDHLSQSKSAIDFKMWSNIKEKIWEWRGVLITAPSMITLTIVGSIAGLFQMPELTTFDYFMSWRPVAEKEHRITIVTIDETDIEQYNFPIPDEKLAKAIELIKQQNPRGIGLDIYRNLPVAPGEKKLIQQFASTDNLVGVEKARNFSGDKAIAPPHTLPKEQVALADVVVDTDRKVRRALLSIEREDGQIQLGLAAQLALMYLAQENIFLENKTDSTLQLGKATIMPFHFNDGGYIKADAGGYQILLNYRGFEDKFQTVSLRDLLEGNLPSNWGKDQIILIGSTAESLNDKFYTPYDSKLLGQPPERMSGVIIHANILSQLISAALDGRCLIRVLPEPLEWLWIIIWGLFGASISWLFFKQNILKLNISFVGSLITINIIIPSSVLVGISYLAFLNGWWIPVFTPFIALTLSALSIPNYKNYELNRMASIDGLTKIANRRYFDEYYLQVWHHLKETKQPLSVILCDVDFFKLYNDNYGHQAGDRCLYQVAQAIAKAVRSTDLVARYGGEEFIVVLPSTNKETAFNIGQRICSQVQNLQIPHSKSKVSHIVTLSCGVATVMPEKISTAGVLIASADSALYDAKQKGRNCVVLR